MTEDDFLAEVAPVATAEFEMAAPGTIASLRTQLAEAQANIENLLGFLVDTRDAALRRDDPEIAAIIASVLAKFRADGEA